jgi:methylglutaconyl-CoA hydratase
MNYQNLRCTIHENGHAEIVLNRPEVHNAFNLALIEEMTHCFKDLEANDQVMLISLSGEGSSFSAGADLNWMRSMKEFSLEENIQDSNKMADMYLTMYDCTKPLIAYCHGNVLGGGMGLLAVCDYVLCHNKTRFGFTETRLGLVPAVIAPYVINKIGESNARAYFISGSKFDADHALRMNLVHETVEADPKSVENARNRMVNSFLKAAPEAAKMAKGFVREVVKLNRKVHREDLIAYTVQTISELRISDEAQEGMSALLSKRSPNWMGK